MTETRKIVTVLPSDRPSLNPHLLVLLGLTAFVISEPILTIFGANPGIFFLHNVDTQFLLCLYAISIALVPPISIWLVIYAIGRVNRRTGIALYYAVVGLLVGLWLIQFAKWSLSLTQPHWLAVVAALGAGAFVFAYIRVPLLENLLKVAAIAPVILMGNFLLFSETGSVSRGIQPEAVSTEFDSSLPSVLFIMLDEFPTAGLLNEEGHIDTARFPNLAALSQQATWYRHYTILAGKTDLSLPSILTAGHPRPVPASYANFPNSLFSLLAPTHHLTVFESLTGLCGLPECGEGPPGQAVEKPDPELAAVLKKSDAIWRRRVSLTSSDGARLDDFQEAVATKPAEPEKSAINTSDRPSYNIFRLDHQVGIAQERFASIEKLMASFVPSELPTFYFSHLVLPHIPWRFYSNGQPYDLPYANPPFSDINNDGGEWIAKLSEYRFMQQAQYTDHLLGEVFSRLKSLGMWDDMLVVVTADHGRSFKLNTNSRRLRPNNFDSTVYVPLFIKYPQQAHGEIDDSNLMAFDLLPTIAGAMEIVVPWEVAGLPAGHAEIAERGDNKVCFPRTDRKGFTLRELQGEQRFSDKQYFPTYSSRKIGSLENVEEPLTLLNGELGLDKYLGHLVREFNVSQGGRAQVKELEHLQNPRGDRAPLGVVMGNLEFEPAGDKVLIAINGRFVSASPLIEFKKTPHTFVAMLPLGALTLENEIGVFVVDGSELVALDIHD